MSRKEAHVRTILGIGVGIVVACSLSGVALAEKATPAGSVAASTEAGMSEAIQDGRTVKIDYTLTVDGAVVDSSDGRGPLSYVQGQGQIIPGLERQLVGLHVGDAKEVTVSPDEGYGQMNPKAVREVPKTQLPADLTLAVGMVLRGTNKEGSPFRARIQKVEPETVTLDLNHPLAGKTLQFKVKVVSVSAG